MGGLLDDRILDEALDVLQAADAFEAEARLQDLQYLAELACDHGLLPFTDEVLGQPALLFRAQEDVLAVDQAQARSRVRQLLGRRLPGVQRILLAVLRGYLEGRV